MLPRCRLWLVTLILAGGTLLEAQQQVFRTGTAHVSVYATVTGRDGRLVTGLNQDQFTLRDNGRRQTFTVFDAAAKPIHLIVMLDTSGSMAGNQRVLRASAVQLFTRLLRGDRARVGHFGEKISFSPAFTNDVDELIRGLWIDVEPGGPTPLWTAIRSAMIELAPIEGRRVVLVLSDGKDNRSTTIGGYKFGPALEDVIAQAHREDVMVYAIGLNSLDLPPDASRPSRAVALAPGRREGSAPDPGLRTLAVETGGGYFELAGTENLSDVFATVADELHQQYLLGYQLPDADGKLHRVEVTLTNPDLTVRARRSYVAPRRGSGGGPQIWSGRGRRSCCGLRAEGEGFFESLDELRPPERRISGKPPTPCQPDLWKKPPTLSFESARSCSPSSRCPDVPG